MSAKTLFWLTPKGLAALGLIGATSYFLFMEHREHLFTYLPLLILLACPLMHLFMHGGYGGHLGHGEHKGLVDSRGDWDYRRGYEDAQREIRNQQNKEDDPHAR